MVDASVTSGETIRDRYLVVRVLGEGALGRTMMARDLEHPRSRRHVEDYTEAELVAIKELLPSRMKRWKDYALFERECETLRALTHPGIPAYREHFTVEPSDPNEPTRLFLVQDFVDGKTLQDHLDEGEEFDEPRVRELLTQALEILGYLHALNPPVIHRDIKPANLMLTPRGKLVMIDFGAVREAVTAEGVGSTIVGTFGYMPPEQYAGKSTPATDLFALGATCVQLLTGRPPGALFEGIHEFNIPADLPITLGFERVLLKLTEPEIERRYQDCSSVLEDLEERFLMVPKENITGVLPIPHELPPAPRPFPGTNLRDAYHGASHLGVVTVGSVAVLASLAFPAVMFSQGNLAGGMFGMFAVVATALMVAAVTARARNEISVYRHGDYTLGEVTGRFISSSAEGGANLTYRYRVGSEFQHGAISTADEAYRTLSPGDPVGVIYLPDEPSEHVMYAVPSKFAAEHLVGVDRRLIESEGRPEREPSPAAEPDRSISLTILGEQTRTVKLDRDLIRIGAQSGAHVHLEAAGVAKVHSVIERTDSGWRIVDSGTALGTCVNGKRISAHDLSSGDVIEIGWVEISTSFEPPAAK